MPTCNSIIPICLYVSACDTGIDTTLISDLTGYLNAFIEFDGTWQRYNLNLNIGDHIIFPNILNGNYTHTVKFIKGDGTLWNNTCYAFNTHTVVTSGNNLTPTPNPINTETMDFLFIVSSSPNPAVIYTFWNGITVPGEYLLANPLNIPYFAGKNVHLPLSLNDTINQEVTYNKLTGGFSFPFADGDKISGQYEQPL